MRGRSRRSRSCRKRSGAKSERPSSRSPTRSSRPRSTGSATPSWDLLTGRHEKAPDLLTGRHEKAPAALGPRKRDGWRSCTRHRPILPQGQTRWSEELMITRRQALTLLGSVAATALLVTHLPAFAENVPAQDLAVPGPLGDIAQGPADAKVTIIEYASMTCPHCAAFHKETYPALKSRYIDSGKVRYVLREFPLDPLATAGFMLARCDGEQKYYPIVDMLFQNQRAWAGSDKPLDALRQMMRQAGFSQEKFDSCLKDQKLYDAVNAVKNRGLETLKVESTPTFFINGQRHVGNLSIDEIEKIIKPMLGV